MTFDEYLDVSIEFASSNFAQRKLVGIRLEFDEGKPMYLRMPDEKEIDDDGEFHPVEQAILDILGKGQAVLHKNLKRDAMKKANCSPSTFATYFRRMKADKIIILSGDGYKLRQRNIEPNE